MSSGGTETPGATAAFLEFSGQGLSSQDLQAIVTAWQAGAISQDTMHYLFRRGEVLPEGRSAREEASLISASPPPSHTPSASPIINRKS